MTREEGGRASDLRGDPESIWNRARWRALEHLPLKVTLFVPAATAESVAHVWTAALRELSLRKSRGTRAPASIAVGERQTLHDQRRGGSGFRPSRRSGEYLESRPVARSRAPSAQSDALCPG